ncbi:M17 family metallopeptidase [Mycoplasma procyoni]|uniref:M17 family metallopeptidase n=1 Tax=Mycoplasma procyoni TaxID=568784 RepID=UPI00197C2E89|nr:leucyl aminopeptidase family protein [Mycoplasma procyoni]MBN3534478.1 leucyl aminopeptidase family protein [Mycoplasma procyoni]
MKITTQKLENFYLLKAVFENKDFPQFVAQKNFKVTDNHSTKESYVYFDSKHTSFLELKKWFSSFASAHLQNYQIDLESFKEFASTQQLLRLFISKYAFAKAELFKMTNEKKEEDQEQKSEIALLVNEELHQNHELIEKLKLVAQNVQKTRNLQIMPENFLNSEILASKITEDFSGIENLKLTVLTKKEISDLGMNLLLSVNKGSTHEPRVVIIEYKGNPESSEHTSVVGKGITFDTGGVNTKGYHMDGMKYDMSGSVIAAYAIKTLAQLKAKVNASAIMCITDNRINGDASLPENVYQSMSGKWVEVVDTDAEGRLVLADGIFYAADKLKPTTIIDVATLTGSIVSVFGNVYTGIWSTNDKKWEAFQKASQEAQEKTWRMPLHEDYNKGNKESKVADLASWSKTVSQDSSQAAMFLKEFTKDIDFIHCDVAGTADKQGEPQGELVATLVEFILNHENNKEQK